MTPARRPLTLKTLALWIGAVAIFGVAATALNRYLKPDVAAHVRPLIAAKWAADPAMKFARVDAVKLTHFGHCEYRGQVDWSMEQYRSSVPIRVVAVRGQPLEWKIDAPNDMPLKVETYIAFQIFYEYPITDEQAGKFTAWMDEQGHIGKEAGSAFLRKAGPAFVFHLPINEGIEIDAKFKTLAKGIAQGLSADVFAGAPVEVHLGDRKLTTLKIVKDR